MKKSLPALLFSIIAAIALSTLNFPQNAIAGEPAPTPTAAPSDVSIAELMTITGMKAMVDNVVRQTDTAMQAKLQQSLNGRAVTPDQKKILDDMRVSMINLMRDTMQWNTLAPRFASIYKNTFTQEEIDGMVAFYKTPAGKAVITKMPAVTQYSMQLTQTLLAELMPKIIQIQKDTLAQLKAAGDKQNNRPPSGKRITTAAAETD